MNHKMISKPKIVIAFIFLCFAVLIFLQFCKVGIYYDDFGYLSLNYGVNATSVGSDYSFSQLFGFLGSYFFGANGRVLYAFIWLSAYKLGGLLLVKLLAALILTVIVFLCYRMVLKYTNAHPLLTAGLACIFFGLIGVVVHRQGTYWFAAFFYYTAPIISLILLGMILWDHIEEEKKMSAGKAVGLFILTVFSAFSTEQFAVTTIFITGILAVKYFWKYKKIPLFFWLLGLTEIISSALLILNPGLLHRAANESNAAFAHLSILSKFNRNVRGLLRIFFDPQNKWFVSAFFAAVFILCILSLMGERRKKWKVLNACCAFAAIVGAVLILFPGIDFSQMIAEYGAATALGLFILLLSAIGITRYYLVKGYGFLLLIFWASVVSLGCLIVSPELPNRIILPFILMSFMLMAASFTGIIGLLKSKKLRLVAAICIVLPIAVVSAKNAWTIYKGYEENYVVLEHNDAALRYASAAIKNGASIIQVQLQTLPQPFYACDMVYDDGLEFMKWWMSSYYDLSYNTVYVFRQLDGDEKLV